MSDAIEPFTLAIAEAELDDLRRPAHGRLIRAPVLGEPGRRRALARGSARAARPRRRPHRLHRVPPRAPAPEPALGRAPLPRHPPLERARPRRPLPRP